VTARIAFTASVVAYDDEGAASLTLAGVDADGAEHYLLLEAQPAAVRIEVDDEGNSAADRIAACRLKRGGIEVDLAGALGAVTAPGVDVVLRLNAEAFSELRAGVEKIFAGTSSLLEFSEK
jgi:hypothetical protein